MKSLHFEELRASIYNFHPSSNKERRQNKLLQHSFPINFIFKHYDGKSNSICLSLCRIFVFTFSFLPFTAKTFFLYINMWKRTWVKPSVPHHLERRIRLFYNRRGDSWNGIWCWGMIYHSDGTTHTHKRADILQPQWKGNWKWQCAQAEAKRKKRNSWSGKIDAGRKISAASHFFHHIQSRDFQLSRSVNEIFVWQKWESNNLWNWK